MGAPASCTVAPPQLARPRGLAEGGSKRAAEEPKAGGGRGAGHWATLGCSGGARRCAPPPSAPPPPPSAPAGLRNCSIVLNNTDALQPSNTAHQVKGHVTQAECCAACVKDPECTAYVYATGSKDGYGQGSCWPLASTGGLKKDVGDRLLGLVGPQQNKPGGTGKTQQIGPQFSDVKIDTYGFFHGFKFTKAAECVDW